MEKIVSTQTAADTLTAGKIAIADTTGNPAPLGLVAFGMTTTLLNLHNAGIVPMGVMILSMGIFYGGIAQIIAGIMEWKKNNTFGTTAFISYGFFWLSLVGIFTLPKTGLMDAANETSVAAFLLLWGVFTLLMFVATLKLNRALQAVFGTLTILFFGLALGDLTGNATLQTVIGYEGILCGVLAIYAGTAQVLNELYGRTVMPLGA